MQNNKINLINSSDIYDISNFINEVKKDYIKVKDENTLSMGIFGYLNNVFSIELQNSIIAMSEYANEAFPIRSKFEKSILTYAMMYDVKNINAVPSVMNILLGVNKDILDANLDAQNRFVIDKDIPIVMGEYTFHLDYDIQIEKVKLINKNIDEYIYTAKYLIDNDNKNPCSDITNPYLHSPIEMITYENDNNKTYFICINCLARQVDTSIKTIKVVTNNIFDNKTVDFEFDQQIVCFKVVVTTANGEVRRLTPYFEGVSINKEKDYCLYSYLDSKTIRIKFIRDCYEPKINDTINIELQVTSGSNGNIEFDEDIIVPLKSERYNYRASSYYVVKPISKAEYGTDRKSVDDLKRIIPKEILARGTIITNKDLENYFNEIDTGKVQFCKKIDNQIQRLYYAYLLVKDANNNVIPTNTLSILINETVFENPTADRLCIEPGVAIRYSDDKCVIEKLETLTTNNALKEEETNFIYTSPFNIVIDRSPLRVSYFMTNVDNEVKTEYSYINNTSNYQFICNSLRCRKNYLVNNGANRYVLDFNITQNTLQDIGLVKSINNKIDHLQSKIRIMLVIEDIRGDKYYTEGILSTVSQNNAYSYNGFFELKCDQSINENNTVTIYDMKRVVKDEDLYILDVKDIQVPETAKMSIYTFIDKDFLGEEATNLENNSVNVFDVIYEHDDGTIFTKDDLNNEHRDYSKVRKKIIEKDADGNIVKENFIISNIYTTYNNLYMFYNFSDCIRSTVQFNKINGINRYIINSVPLVRYSYINDPANMHRYTYLFKHIQDRKFYMDIALTELEESFDFDLKFFNTYGPSTIFRIGRSEQPLNRVNLTMKFVVKLFPGIDRKIVQTIKDNIKTYVENINENVDDIHMSNLIKYILDSFSDTVKYIEFVDINGMDTSIQYLQKKDNGDIDKVPEFLNINLLDNYEPDIDIKLV